MPLAKLYAAVYYPSDILAGAAVGILTSYFIYKIVMPLLRFPIGLVFIILRKLCLA
jgi:membrane-associated phospholipid phosphatase